MWESSLRKLLLRGSQYVVHVARLSNSKLESFIMLMDLIERPGAGYSRSEGSVAKFEVYLGRATAARALRAELEDIQTQLRHHSLRVSVEFLAAHWRQDHRARARAS